MARDSEVPTFRVGGVPVAALDMGGLVQSIRRSLGRGSSAPGSYVTFCGAHGIVESQVQPRLQKAYEDAWLSVADGRPLFWLGRLRGFRSVRQVPGIESMEIICRAGLAEGWSHYFLGGAPGVAESLATKMAELVPGLRVAGFEMPPFRPLSPRDLDVIRTRIRESGAQIVWVGLGAPKQELFMSDLAVHLPGTVSLGVGAAFDFNTGRMRRAPRVVQVAGLEWAYRLLLEPRRLWPRYSVVVPRFLALVVPSLLYGTPALDRHDRRSDVLPSEVYKALPKAPGSQ